MSTVVREEVSPVNGFAFSHLVLKTCETVLKQNKNGYDWDGDVQVLNEILF